MTSNLDEKGLRSIIDEYDLFFIDVWGVIHNGINLFQNSVEVLERLDENKKNYSGIETNQFHIDILVARFVLNPEWFDVVVASNLFGDILSDLGPACTGTIGIAPSGNINPEKKFPSLFEPVHGSAPDIAGKGIANPIGQIWSGALMLDYLGEKEAANSIMTSIEKTLFDKKNRTKDLNGESNTIQCAQAVLDNL